MADDSVQVKFGAQTSELEAGAKKASDAVKSSIDQMKGSMDSVKSSFTSFHTEMQSGFESITAAVTKFSGAIMAIGALLAGGAIFKGAVDEYVKMNSEAKKLSVTMGMNVGDSQALLETFKRFGVEGDTVTSSMMMMTRQLKNNEDGFTRNGIVTRDSGGNLLTMNEIMFNSINRLKEMEAGTERNMLATTLFGRQVGNLPGFLKMSEEAVEAMKKRLFDLGIALDDVSVAKARAYKEGMSDVALVGSALKYKLGEELIPVLIQLAHFFADVGPPAIKAFGDAFRAVQSFLMNATVMASDLRDGFLQAWDQIKIGAQTAFTSVKAIVSGNFAEAAAAAAAGYASMQANSAAWRDQAVRDANEVRFSIMSAMQVSPQKADRPGIMGAGSAAPAPKTPEGGDAFVGKEGKGKGGESSIVAQWQNELDELKLANKSFQDQTLIMEKTFWASKLAMGVAATKEEELALKAGAKAAETERLKKEQDFWKEKLSTLDNGTKEYITVEHKIVALETQINKNRLQGEVDLIKSKMAANQQGGKDYEALLEHQSKLDKLDLEMKKANVNYMTQMNKFSKAEELKEYRKLLLEEQKADLEREQQKLKSMARDKILYKKQLDDLELLKKKQALDLQKIDQQISIAEQSTWGKVFDSVGNGFSNLFSSLLSGSQDFGSAMINVFKTIGSAIANIFIEMGLAAIKSFVMTEIAQKVAGLAEVTTSAAIAGAAGVASVMVALPFPINIATAPGIGAAAFAEAMMYAPAAKGGWDVPADSMAMLHAGEMVLPASLADNVRNMTGGGGGPITVHFAPNIHYRMTQSEWYIESRKMMKAINRVLSTHGKAPLGPSYA